MSRGTCLECGDVIESKHRHDFVQCKCGKSFLDGGDDYLRFGGRLVPDFSDVFDGHEDLDNDWK
jgi:hypothetical protein